MSTTLSSHGSTLHPIQYMSLKPKLSQRRDLPKTPPIEDVVGAVVAELIGVGKFSDSHGKLQKRDINTIARYRCKSKLALMGVEG